MGIRARNDMDDWIIYYRESHGRYEHTPAQLRKGQHFYPGDIVIKEIRGTEEEAKAEAKREELAAGITGPFNNQYSYVTK